MHSNAAKSECRLRKPDYKVYFYCQVSRPFEDFGIWSAEIPGEWVRKRDEINEPRYHDAVARAEIHAGLTEKQGKHLGFYTEFGTSENEEILLKCGISFVSMEGAEKNLASDSGHWDFDRTAAEARELWDEALQCINVEGGTEKDRIKFYTALYHTMIDPRVFMDVDGKFRGADNKVYGDPGLNTGPSSADGTFSVPSSPFKPLSIPPW